MGVSGLLRNVLKKYPSVHLPAPNPNIKVDYLFIDFNAFIYNTIHAFPTDIIYDFSKNNDTKNFEERLVKLVIENTKRLINDIVKPSKLVYIAVDGPPPLAKMVQQRERRYKNPYMEQIIKKHDPTKIITGAKYDTNRITPGTPLMTLLNKEFEKVIQEGAFGNIAVVYDGSNIPGEAEHKYLNLMEKIKDNSKETYVIVSGDGDVILLSLRFPRKKIYIMQNVANTALEDVYPPTQEFAYLDCRRLGDSIYDFYENVQIGGTTEKNLLGKLEKNMKIENANANSLSKEKQAFLMDFIFLSFLEGNDFAKAIYFMKFKEDKMRTPLGIYRFQRKIHNNDPNFRLIKEVSNDELIINQPFLLAIFKRLGTIEMDKIEEMKKTIERKISNPPIKRNNNKPNAVEHKLFTNQDHILHSEYVKQYDFLFGDMPNFKKRYYEYFWNNEYDVEKIVKSYLNILLFNIRYYFGYEISWRMDYHALTAPMPSDVVAFLEKNPDYLRTIKLEKGEPVHPFVLLAFVMPPQSMEKGIVPKKYMEKLLKEYPQYFPEKVDLKLMQAGGKLIYAEPYMENPPIEILEEVLKTIKLTKEEKERNELKKEPMIYLGK